MTEVVVEKPLEKFGSLFKAAKYRQRIVQMALHASTSVVVDFEDLLMIDPHLADMLMERPQEYLAYANSAAFEQLQLRFLNTLRG